jgi:hypothetical protein
MCRSSAGWAPHSLNSNPITPHHNMATKTTDIGDLNIIFPNDKLLPLHWNTTANITVPVDVISLIWDNSVTSQNLCDFSGQTFKGFEVLQFSTSATTTQLLSSGKFCKLRYDTIPVKSASTKSHSIPITQKCQILSCDTRRKWTI